MLCAVCLVGCATPKEKMSVEEAFKPGEKAAEEPLTYDLRWARQFGPSSVCERAAAGAGPESWTALQACSLRGDLTELDDVIAHFAPLADRPNVHAVVARVLAARGLVFSYDLPKLQAAGIDLLPSNAVFEMSESSARGRLVIFAGRLSEASQTLWSMDEQNRGDVDAYNWTAMYSPMSSSGSGDPRSTTYKGVGKGTTPSYSAYGARKVQDSIWEDTGTLIEARFPKTRKTPQLGGRWLVIGRFEKATKLATTSGRSLRLSVLAAVPLQ